MKYILPIILLMVCFSSTRDLQIAYQIPQYGDSPYYIGYNTAGETESNYQKPYSSPYCINCK